MKVATLDFCVASLREHAWLYWGQSRVEFDDAYS